MLKFLLPLLVAFVTFASPAHADLKLKVLKGGFAGGGGGGSANFALQPTQKKLIDLTADLASGAADDWYATCVTGTVDLLVWPEQTLTNGQCYNFRKRELLTMLGAETNGDSLSPAAGTLNITWSNGSTSKTFAVETLPADLLNWDFGLLTYGRFGGFTLANLPAGECYAIDSQVIHGGATIDAFEIYPTPSNDTTCNGHRVTIKSATYGGAKTYGGFTAGTQYDIVVRGRVSGNLYTIKATAIERQFDVAPVPTGMTDNTANNQLAGAIYRSYCFGDTIMIEDGFIGPPTAATDPDQGRGADQTRSACKPGPDGNNILAPVDERGPWYDATASAWRDWIHARSRSYLGATIRNFNHIGVGDEDHSKQYVMYDNIQTAAGPGLTFKGDSGPERISWVGVKNAYIRTSLGFNATANQSEHQYAIDNFFPGESETAIYINAKYAKVIGNVIKNNNQDGIKHAIWCPIGEGSQCEISWNLIYNKWQKCNLPDFICAPSGDGYTHSDFDQGNYTSISCPGCTGSMTLSHTGNAYLRGYASPGNAGYPGTDGQMLYTDVGPWSSVEHKMTGQIIVAAGYAAHPKIGKAAAGSWIRNLTLIKAFDVTTVGPSAPLSNPVIAVSQGGSTLQIKDSFVATAGVLYFSDQDPSPTPNPTVVNSLGSISRASLTSAGINDTDFYSLANTNFKITWQQIIDAATPDPGSALEGKGAIVFDGNGKLKIDYRLRTVDPSILVP